MLDRLRSFLHDAWPFVGAAYLSYLALRPPPVRYVGVGGLVVVTPLLLGWTVGRLFGVGPWADSASDERTTADDSGTPDGTEASSGSTASSEPAGSDDGKS